MPRRIHIPLVRAGHTPLDPIQARHARTVLRLPDGAAVEVFDDAGRVAPAVLVFDGPNGAAVRVDDLNDSEATDEDEDAPRLRWTVAAAVPKGDRADWMVEKLSELGTAAFVPLAAARSVVLPEGRGKHDRWARLATESAKQCRRRGVMRIEPLAKLADVVARVGGTLAAAGWYLSTAPGAVPVVEAAASLAGARDLTLFIGPEGGWTDGELAGMAAAGLTPVRLTETILRVETAAVAAAVIAATIRPAPPAGGPTPPACPAPTEAHP